MITGSYEQAVAWFRRVIEANRNYPIAYFHLAVALADQELIFRSARAAEAQSVEPQDLEDR